MNEIKYPKLKYKLVENSEFEDFFKLASIINQ